MLFIWFPVASDLQVQLVPGEAVREELGALLVLMRDSGLEGMQYFPPHGAHARAEAALLFELVTLEESKTPEQLAGGSAALQEQVAKEVCSHVKNVDRPSDSRSDEGLIECWSVKAVRACSFAPLSRKKTRKKTK